MSISQPIAEPVAQPAPAPAPSAPTRVRVAQVGPHPAGFGGMQSMLRMTLASPLADRYRLHMISTWRPGPAVIRHLTYLAAVAKLAVWCVGRGPRVAHIHATVRGSLYRKSLLVVLARALRRPVIVHVHGGQGDFVSFWDRAGSLRRRWLRHAFAQADRVIAVSDPTAAEVARRLGRADVRVLRTPPPRVTPRPRPGPRDGVEIAFLGGFVNPVKGGEVLLAALAEAIASVPGVSATLAGPGGAPDGLERFDGAVRFVGWLDDLGKAELLAGCDLFVLPSLSEGLPVALLEALAYGKAIVATPVGGIPEVVSDGLEAVLVPPGDVRALAAAIISLAGDPQARERLGAAARRRADTLDDGAYWRRLDELYAELAEAPR